MRTGYGKFQSVADLVDFMDMLREQVGISDNDTRDKMRAALASIDETDIVVIADAHALLRLSKDLLGTVIDRLAGDAESEGLAEIAQAYVYVDRVIEALATADRTQSLAMQSGSIN